MYYRYLIARLLHAFVFTVILLATGLYAQSPQPLGGGIGWAPLPVSFHVQWPTNVSEGDRYWATNNIYHCEVFSTDGAFSVGSTTLPRTEQRFEPDYTNGGPQSIGEIQYQSMEMAPSNENSYCVFQIHTGDAEEDAFGSTTFMLFWFTNYNGSVRDYSGTQLATNLGNQWFQVNVDHNLIYHTVRVWINQSLVWTQQDNYAGDFYFKDGVYEQDHNPTLQMDTYVTNILMWTNSGIPGPLWNGGSATDSYWSNAANWSSNSITAEDQLFFGGTSRLNNTNNTTAGTSYASINFNDDAGIFNLYGNPVILAGGIFNYSANTQADNIPMDVAGNITLNSGTAGMILGSGITNVSATLYTIHLQGTNGILAGPVQSSGSGLPNNLALQLDLTSGGSNSWSMIGNNSSYLTNLTVAGGSLSLGTGTDSPFMAITNNTGDPFYIGTATNTTAVFNLNSGTLDSSYASEQPLEMGELGSTGILNINGGTLNLNGKYIQIGDSGGEGIVNQSGGTVNAIASSDFILGNQTNATGVLNISGGTFNIPSSAYVAFRGSGIWNLSGSGMVVVDTILNMARNNADSDYASATVNLNGGTLVMNQESMGNSAIGQTGAFNFNGGVLQAAASSTTFLSPANSPSVFTTTVQAGGAIINDGGFTITVSSPLVHQSSLGATPDGGLMKQGGGTLTLSAANTYTGSTTIGAGTLSLSGSGSIASSPKINIAGGATFNVSGLSSFSLGASQTLSNSTSTANIIGNANTGSGKLSLTYASGTPSLSMASGTLALSSSTVVNINNTGAPLAVGVYTIITNGTGGSVSGTPPSTVTVTGGAIPAQTTASLVVSNSMLDLVVSPVVIVPSVPPGIVSFNIAGGNVVINATNGVNGGTYYLLSSTNLPLPVWQWMPLATDTINAAGPLGTFTFSGTNAQLPNEAQQFYILSNTNE